MKNKPERTLFADHSIRVIERRKGFYWQYLNEKPLHGPFATLFDAVENFDARQDQHSADVDLPETCGYIEEVEDLIGMADWIDPDTGLPAEENVPRLTLH